MKKILLAFLIPAISWAGAVQLNQITNSNALHGLPTGANAYTGTYAQMAAVTNQWCGDHYYATDIGQEFLYQCSTPIPNGTPANGSGSWVPFGLGSTPTNTWTITPTWTITNTPTSTASYTPTPTGSFTPTKTATFTPTATGANTATNTPTVTATPTFTPTFTPANTYTPVVGSDVVLTGFTCDGLATGVTVLGNRIQVTGITGVVPGDYVAFNGLLPISANTLWPVVASTTNYFEVATTQPGIISSNPPTPETTDVVAVFRGDRCKNLNLISGVTVIGATYQFNFTDNQPDVYFGEDLGGAYAAPNSLLLPFDYTMSNNSIIISFGGFVPFSKSQPTSLSGSAPTSYFYIKLSGIQ